MQVSRTCSLALLLGLVVLPLTETTLAEKPLANPSATPSATKRQHGTVLIKKEWDSGTPLVEPTPRRSTRTKSNSVVITKQPASKPIAAAKPSPSPRPTPAPKKPAKKN